MAILVPGVGSLAARLVVIGEAPGRSEVEHDPPMPFVGASGQILTRALGWGAREQAYITNVRKTPPPKKESAKEKAASLAEWLPTLQEEIATLQNARTVLLVGGDALEAVLGIRQISYYHGSVFSRAEVDGIRSLAQAPMPPVPTLPPQLHSIVVTLHPAYALRGKPQFKPMISTTIARAARWANQDEGPTRPPDYIFDLETNAGRLAEFLAAEDNARQAISFDVETAYDDSRRIEMCGVATNQGVRVFPWSLEHQEVMREFFARPGVVVGHNVSFDLAALAAYGIYPIKKKVVDTIAAAALLWPPNAATKKARWLALSPCTMRVLDGVPYWKAIPKGEGPPDTTVRDAIYRASWPVVPDWLLGRLYCGLDNYYTDKLWRAERALLKKEAML